MENWIQSLFIFNPTHLPVVPKPTEEDYALCKLLYYYPENADTFEKQSHVGLAEGLVTFSTQFSSEPLETIHTELHTHTLREVEPNIWIVIVTRFSKKKTDLEYEMDVSSYINEFYNGFHLFHGCISSFTYPQDVYNLQNLLDDYLPVFLAESVHMDDAFDGFFYCPMDKRAYLQTQFFVNLLITQVPDIRHVLITYEGNLVSTTLQHDHALILYKYFADKRNWRRLREFNRAVDPSACFYGRCMNYSKQGYIYGIHGQNNWMPRVQFPGQDATYSLMAFVEEQLQIIILMNHQEYELKNVIPINQILSENSSQLLQTVATQYSRTLLQEDNYKFIYYNSMNFAIKKSTKIGDMDTFSKQVIRYFSTGDTTKSMIRTSSTWVCSLRSLDSRDIYIVLPASTPGPQKVEEETTRFINEYFHNLFLGI